MGTNMGRKGENASCPSQQGPQGKQQGEAVGQCWGHVALSIVGTCSPCGISQLWQATYLRPPCHLISCWRASPRVFGSVPEPPSKGELLWKRSLTPPPPLAAPLLFRPIGSARGSCSMPTKSLFHLQSLKCQRRQCRVSELPPDPISSQSPLHLPSSLHLQDRGCDFPLTLATAVTRNCRAGSKLQIQRDKDYFPQKRGENCCICKDFPGPVPSRAHLSGVTPSFKHPSFHSRSRNHLH